LAQVFRAFDFGPGPQRVNKSPIYKVICSGRISLHVLTSIRIFVNPRSGSPEAGSGRLIEHFAALGCRAVCTPLKRSTLLRALASTDPLDMAYIAAGGDGTVSTVAAAIAGSGRALGVLPRGTLNHFARDLGLPLSMEEAAKVIVAGATRMVDAAELNGIIFVNNSSLGVYPAMASRRQRLRGVGWNRWTALVIASAKAFVRFREVEIELTAAGERRCCITPFVFIGNNRYCLDGSEGLGGRTQLDEGLLSIALAPGMSRVGSLRFLLLALTGRAGNAPELHQFQAEHARMTVRKPVLRVSLDGEVRRLRPPLEYRIRPGALRVLCPLEQSK
jgi:diacylglycerol kinase family enzyme